MARGLIAGGVFLVVNGVLAIVLRWFVIGAGLAQGIEIVGDSSLRSHTGDGPIPNGWKNLGRTRMASDGGYSSVVSVVGDVVCGARKGTQSTTSASR